MQKLTICASYSQANVMFFENSRLGCSCWETAIKSPVDAQKKGNRIFTPFANQADPVTFPDGEKALDHISSANTPS